MFYFEHKLFVLENYVLYDKGDYLKFTTHNVNFNVERFGYFWFKCVYLTCVN